MAEMTGGQALVASLIREGVNTIFGLPGVQLDGAFDALYDAQARGEIIVYWPRHEQATAYMADGYARTTGREGVCMVVPGPGLLNASAALSTAYSCNSPVLCISGQVQSEHIEAGRGLLHEIPNQMQMISSVTKWQGRAMRPQDIPRLVHEAFRELRSGRPRPVEIEIPPDVLFARADVELMEPARGTRPQGDPDLIRQAAQLLGQAESPVIFVGGGILASGAWEELRQVAEALQAPVVQSRNGRGSLSDRHELAQYPITSALLLEQADVVLAVGTRFLEPATAEWGIKGHHKLIHINVDPEDIGRIVRPTIGIEADAKPALLQLFNELGRSNRQRPSRRDELLALKERAREKVMSINPQAEFGMAIRRALPDEGIFVSEMTQVGYWASQGYPVYQPRTFVSPGYQGTLGFGYGCALGVKVANPDRPVVSIAGDGGFMFQVQELATAARHKIGVVAVVFNDNAYGNVRRIQRRQFNERTIASDLTNPDFVKLAEAFGIAGRRCQTGADLETAITEALKANEPTLIEVPVGEMPVPYGIQLRAAVRA